MKVHSRNAAALVFAALISGTLDVRAAEWSDGGEWIYVSKLPLDQPAPSWGSEGEVHWYVARPGSPGTSSFVKAHNDREDDFVDQVKAQGLSRLPTRTFWTKGMTVNVVYVYSTGGACKSDFKSSVTFTETGRRSAIGSGLSQLLGLATKDREHYNGALSEKRLCFVSKTHRLTEKRADLLIQLVLDSDTKSAVNVITGPEEHWFLSADVVTKGANELKYDPVARTITEKEKPQQLYLGINYMRGDIYGEHDRWSLDRFVYRMMLSGSSRPLDSFGVALGYRFGAGRLEKEVGGFMLSVAAVWAKREEIAATVGDRDVVESHGHGKPSFRVVMSYSLDSALNWLD